MRNRYTKGLLQRKSPNLQISGRLPLSSRVSDCLATPLALTSSWKSKGAARRIVKDKGSGLIKPVETHLFVNMFRGRTECDVLLPTSAFIRSHHDDGLSPTMRALACFLQLGTPGQATHSSNRRMISMSLHPNRMREPHNMKGKP